MKKGEFLEYWNSIEDNQKVKPFPVAYKHEGTTYLEDGIRITGSKAFVESVLSRLKDLLRFEGMNTRLQVVYNQTKDRDTGELVPDSFNCYIQVHERGPEACMCNAILGARSKKTKEDNFRLWA